MNVRGEPEAVADLLDNCRAQHALRPCISLRHLSLRRPPDARPSISCGTPAEARERRPADCAVVEGPTSGQALQHWPRPGCRLCNEESFSCKAEHSVELQADSMELKVIKTQLLVHDSSLYGSLKSHDVDIARAVLVASFPVPRAILHSHDSP